MKILFWLSFLILIPLIVGFTLFVSGISAGVWIMEIGVPAVMLVLLIAGLIMLMKGKLFAKKNDGEIEKTEEGVTAELSEKEKEQSAVDAVNNSAFYKNKSALAEYEADSILNATRQASKKGFILGLGFFFLLVLDAITATVLVIKNIWIGAIVCAALFGGTIICILISVAVRQAISMHGDVGKAEKIIKGKVVSCTVSSIVTSDAPFNSKKINGVVYRVKLCADGAEYVTYSKLFYQTDEEVTVAVFGKKRVKIVGEAELEALNFKESNAP